MKRSEIDIEGSVDNLIREIQSLEQKKKEIQSWISQWNNNFLEKIYFPEEQLRLSCYEI